MISEERLEEIKNSNIGQKAQESLLKLSIIHSKIEREFDNKIKGIMCKI